MASASPSPDDPLFGSAAQVRAESDDELLRPMEKGSIPGLGLRTPRDAPAWLPGQPRLAEPGKRGRVERRVTSS